MTAERTQLPYVFIIGFNKCGTSSLHGFFEANGFSSIHWDDGKLALTMLSNAVHGRKILHGYDRKYRVFSDLNFLSWRMDLQANRFFRVLDRDYPGSFFIYNTRDMGRWLKSRANHVIYDRSTILTRSMAILNTENPDDVYRAWIRERIEFEREIWEYFSGRDDFVELNIETDDVPGKISRLLRRDLDPAAWKHLHKTTTAAP